MDTAHLVRRRRASLLVLALPFGLAACSSPEKQPPRGGPDPAPWTYEESLQGNVFTMRDSVDATGSDERALDALTTKACRRAVELGVKDILADETKFVRNEAAIRRDFLEHAEAWSERHEVLEKQRGEKTLSAKVQVVLARTKLQVALEDRHLLHENAQHMRVVVVVRKPAPGVEASGIARGYLDDLAADLSRELTARGFQAKLWNDVRLRLAERRDQVDPQLEKFLTTYVEDSTWRKPEDERYALPLLVLRTEGRILIGYQIVELEKNEMSLRTLMKADAYDLVNAQSLGYETERGELAMGDLTGLEARQQLVTETSRKLTKRIVEKLGAFYDQQMADENKAPSYTLTFKGYDERQVSTIQRHLAAIVAENIATKTDADRSLVVSARINRDPIPVSEEIERSLKLLGLPCGPPRIDGNALTFAKE